MLTHQKLADLKPKDNIEGVYLVKNLNLSEAKDGKKYISLMLSDASGELDSRIWHNCEDLMTKINKSDFVKIKGKVNYFQGKRQLSVTDIHPVASSEVNMDDFVMKAARSPVVMYEELMSIVHELSDIYIKNLLINILSDEEIKRRLMLWQAGKTIHHAYQSGLLEHILSCTFLGMRLSEHYNVNASYVVAGTVLHDLCKIYELTDGLVVDYTEEGKLIGHLVKGLELIDRFSYKIKGFPYQMKMHLKHILLSHHGEYSYGSPKIPHTSEAMLVHLIDLMDSKMNTFDTIRKLDPTPGHWSQFNRHLDRIVFKDELPTYHEWINAEEEHPGETRATEEKLPKSASHLKPEHQVKSEKNETVSAKAKLHQGELKQNLGTLLSGLKIDEKNKVNKE